VPTSGGTGTAVSHAPRLRVVIGTAPADRRDLFFDQPFRIGRVEACDVCIKDEYVSRAHAEVVFEEGQWRVRDLQSANGIFVAGQRVESAAIPGSLVIQLGVAGPVVSFEVEQPAPPPAPPVPPPAAAAPPGVGSETMVARYAERYFGDLPAGQPVGEHTAMIRRAFQQVQTKQKRKYGGIVAALAVAVVAVAAYALYLHLQVSKQKGMAKDLFYAMKSVDLDIANVERLVADSHNQQAIDQVRKYESRRTEMQKSYDRFLSTLHVYDTKLTEQQRLILRVARIFGECELDMPPEFAAEVGNYIKKWQSSARLANAIRTARENGYTQRIKQEFLAQDLPPEFFYLGLQESDFDQYISGPETRKGIAKGMWQFIPETALKYGLHLGPLIEFRRPDPADDRHHWDRETVAAARYIKDLYSTDAQASGLLVMACYNWGEDSVLPLVDSMPPNPRERNFWQLLTKYRKKIPQETYDYVFYISSAAVIGENPRLFGFDFDPPLR
jgi:membrane-bound lytic murein transglycosylase D